MNMNGQMKSLLAMLLICGMAMLSSCESPEWKETGLLPPEPMQVSVRPAAVGSFFILMEDGGLWLWGWHTLRLFLDEPVENYYAPVKIMDNVVAVSCSVLHTMAIKSDGVLWAWGNNMHRQISSGLETAREHRHAPMHIMDDVISVHADSGQTFAITSDGALWAWGRNWDGLLGYEESEMRYADAPVRIMNDALAVTSRRHAAAIRHDNTLWVWGGNQYSNLGDGARVRYRHAPAQVMKDVVYVSVGFDRTMAITIDGALWAWGGNDRGQLGDGTTRSRRQPVRIKDNVVAVTSGTRHTLAITSDGALWAWGDNRFGQLGDGAMQDRHSPVKIMENVVYASAIFSRSMAITRDGSVWAWGENSGGGLGIGTLRGAWERGPFQRGEMDSAWLSPMQVMVYAQAE